MVDKDSGALVQRLLLGTELRRLREKAGLTAEKANLAIAKWYRGKLGKIENGLLNISDDELMILLDSYDVSGSAADHVRSLAEESRRKVAPARVPDWSKQYVGLERNASEIRIYFCGAIPGLFQATAYAEAQLATSLVVAAADIPDMAEERQRRGDRLFEDGAPHVWAVLDEETLRRGPDDPDVMRGQLQRLRALAELGNVSIRVVPFSAGFHSALSYPFTLLYLGDARATVAYLEVLTDAYYIRDARTYSLAFDRVQRIAMCEDDTRALLDRLVDN